MTVIFQIENIKLIVLFALIASVIVMSHFGVAPATPRKVRRHAGTAVPAHR